MSCDDPPREELGPTATCWCGVTGHYHEMFDDSALDTHCGGTGFVHCYCGGDLCVCHHHGREVPCLGCEDCRGDPDDPDHDDYFPGEEDWP